MSSNNRVRQRPSAAATGSAAGSPYERLAGGREDARPKTFLEKVRARAMSMIWLVLSSAAIVHLELTHVWWDARLNRTAATLALLSFGVATGVFVYLQAWAPYVQKRTIDLQQWQRSAPTAIPVATAAGVVGFITSCAALWPIYHVLSLVLVSVLFLGFVTAVSLF
ncbi:hypothetical protein BC828DRAFT_404502 [Blastocladiella britannica]|nr:hypothetical protein BC828DRAFT_404502 [Blastocladiella britannica]